ncbi:hypothetical protein TWF481_006210 [Arthrobotrys musiformis]|uniref:Uncharacterized protein n=1 Tax=Arthrobotrys musiformis TaxID=47236 RepID=A0AAV9WG75_9PEZI
MQTSARECTSEAASAVTSWHSQSSSPEYPVKGTPQQLSVNPKEKPLPRAPQPTTPPNTPTENTKFDLRAVDLFPRPSMAPVIYKDVVNPHFSSRGPLQNIDQLDLALTRIQQHITEQKVQASDPTSPHQTTPDMAKQRSRSQKDQMPASHEDGHKCRPDSATIPPDQLPRLIVKYRAHASETTAGVRVTWNKGQSDKESINAAFAKPPTLVLTRRQGKRL